MFVLNGKRINIWAPYQTADGVRYGNLVNPEVRAAVGVQELPEPAPPEDYSEETYYRVESEAAPYVTYTRRSDEQIAQTRANRIKVEIQALEAGQARCLREATLTGDKTRLQALEDSIAALRSQLATLQPTR